MEARLIPGPEVLFKTCVATKFVNDDDDDDTVCPENDTMKFRKASADCEDL